MLNTSSKINLKIGLFNAENLFLLFDHELPQHYEKLNETQWQKLSTSVYDNKPLSKVLKIAQIIASESPDIMMLCEVGGRESLLNLNKYFLNETYHCVLIEGNSDRHIDVGFLVKKDLKLYFDINTNKNRPLTQTKPFHTQQTMLFTRDCIELKLFTKSKEDPFLVLLLTHLKSRLDPERTDPGGIEKRSSELNTLVQIYSELKKQDPLMPIVLAGDMNGFAGRPNTDSEFCCIYDKTSLQDVLELAQISHENRSTFYQIKNGKKPDGKQIDYCFISEELVANLNTEKTYVYRFKDEYNFELSLPKNIEEKELLPSDHYPIFFTLENLHAK